MTVVADPLNSLRTNPSLTLMLHHPRPKLRPMANGTLVLTLAERELDSSLIDVTVFLTEEERRELIEILTGPLATGNGDDNNVK